jgi:hypothetical protein
MCLADKKKVFHQKKFKKKNLNRFEGHLKRLEGQKMSGGNGLATPAIYDVLIIFYQMQIG